jgi:hypothetical protein
VSSAEWPSPHEISKKRQALYADATAQLTEGVTRDLLTNSLRKDGRAGQFLCGRPWSLDEMLVEAKSRGVGTDAASPSLRCTFGAAGNTKNIRLQVVAMRRTATHARGRCGNSVSALRPASDDALAFRRDESRWPEGNGLGNYRQADRLVRACPRSDLRVGKAAKL